MLVGSKVGPVRMVDKHAAICEPIVKTMWDRQHLTILQTSTACYGESFTLCKTEEGTKGVVCRALDTHLVGACARTNHRKCQVLVLSSLHACPRIGPWATCMRLSHAKAEREFTAL
jgi:hypothetical protein